MKRFILGISAILILTTWGCMPAAPAPTEMVIPPSSTATLSPTPTNTPTPQATSTPTLTPSPTPGPDIDLLYFSGGEIRRFHMQDWSEEIIPVQNNGKIQFAALSPDQSWLAYKDDEGTHILKNPFETQFSPSKTYFVYNAGFSFSNDNAMLAYSDDVGLQLHNLNENTSYELLTHSLNFEDLSKYHSFSPKQWSPDNQWLWISVFHWEGISYLLANIPTQTLYLFNGCYSDIKWLPDSQSFLATVRFSGMYGCGEEDGVYLVTLNKNGTYTEKRIYEDSLPAPVWDRESTALSLSPDNKLISFAQIHFPYTTTDVSRLISSNLNGGDQKELDDVSGRIASPLWSEDGKSITYIVQRSGISAIKRIITDSGEITELCLLPEHVVFTSNIDGTSWLVAINEDAIYRNDYAEYGIYLINEDTGEVIKVSGPNEVIDVQLSPTATPREPKIPE